VSRKRKPGEKKKNNNPRKPVRKGTIRSENGVWGQLNPKTLLQTAIEKRRGEAPVGDQAPGAETGALPQKKNGQFKKEGAIEKKASERDRHLVRPAWGRKDDKEKLSKSIGPGYGVEAVCEISLHRGRRLGDYGCGWSPMECEMDYLKKTKTSLSIPKKNLAERSL